jgi:hypothetical protein
LDPDTRGENKSSGNDHTTEDKKDDKTTLRQPEPDGKEAHSSGHRHTRDSRVGMRNAALLADCLSATDALHNRSK